MKTSSVTSEVSVLDADTPTANFRVVHPRQQDMEYDVAHHGAQEARVAGDRRVGSSQLHRRAAKGLEDGRHDGHLAVVLHQRSEGRVEDRLAGALPLLRLGVECKDRIISGSRRRGLDGADL